MAHGPGVEGIRHTSLPALWLIYRDRIVPGVSWSLLDGILGLDSSVWGEGGGRGARHPYHQSLKANSKTGV